MREENSTSRIFQIPKNCKDFSSDKLLLVLENLIFYPERELPDIQNYKGEWVQKRFEVCQESKKCLRKLKEIHGIQSDRSIVGLAILNYLNIDI